MDLKEVNWGWPFTFKVAAMPKICLSDIRQAGGSKTQRGVIVNPLMLCCRNMQHLFTHYPGWVVQKFA